MQPEPGLADCKFGIPEDFNARKGGWITTFTGRHYWVSDPRSEDVCLEDIAHALSRICRYGGHIEHHYSVAQHCVEVAWAVWQATGSKAKAFHGVLHDATETYVGDMVSPLKVSQPGYRETEDANWLAIAEAFDVSPDLPEEVHVADKRVCATEFRDLRADVSMWAKVEPYPWRVVALPAEQAKLQFLATFHSLWPYRARRA